MSKIQKYLIEGVCGAFIILFVMWVIGYLLNGLYAYKFQLESVWAGVSALGGAGVLALIKYIMDSTKNSVEGEKPYELSKENGGSER